MKSSAAGSLAVGLWNIPFADVVEVGLGAAQVPVRVIRESPEACARMLVGGAVDVAMIPTLTAFLNPEQFDILPAFALSSWGYPFAQIFLKGGLDAPTPELVIPPDSAQESFLAGVVLQEHYGSQILAVPSDVRPRDDVNHLRVGTPEPSTDPRLLDLGREWFELTGYPMVWGLMAVRAGGADQQLIRLFRDVAAGSERLREEVAAGFSGLVGDFIREDLRFRMDDLATASLSELADYVFYYSGTDEPAELNIVSLGGSSAGSGDVDDEYLPSI